MIKKLACSAAMAVVVAGCSSVVVNKNPSDDDSGIRYYRPKPYLLITPNDDQGRTVKLKLEYLPDFSEEYSIRPRGRRTKVALKDGWNLVGVNVDAPPPEPAEAIAAGVPPAPGKDMPPIVVAATNVPIGYYESILEKQQDGRKLFKGWRYIGFTLSPAPTGSYDPKLPICGTQDLYNASRGGGGPCQQHGGDAPTCRPSEVSEPLFGLVFINGAMTFRQTGEIAANQGCPFYVETPKPAPPPQVEDVQGIDATRPKQEGGVGAERPKLNAPPTPGLN